MQEEVGDLAGIESVRHQVPSEFARATGYRATMDTSLHGTHRMYVPSVRT